MPIVIVQQNEKVVEAKFICDNCGKHIKTSLITQKEADAQKSKAVTCWHCKKSNAK
jgi:hypothetical protein